MFLCNRAAWPFCRLRPVCRLATRTSAGQMRLCTLDVHLRVFRNASGPSEQPARLFDFFTIATLPAKCTQLRHSELIRPSVPSHRDES